MKKILILLLLISSFCSAQTTLKIKQVIIPTYSKSQYDSVRQADSTSLVHKAGLETITGQKNFLSNVGIGTSAPNSTLNANGSFSLPYRPITAARTLDATDYSVDCTAGSFTLSIPTGVGIKGRLYIISNSGGGTITVSGSGQTFNGGASVTVTTGNPLWIQSTGTTNWLILKQ